MRYENAFSKKTQEKFVFLFAFYSPHVAKEIKSKWKCREITIQGKTGLLIENGKISQKNLKKYVDLDQGIKDGTIIIETPEQKARKERAKKAKLREEQRIAQEQHDTQLIADFENANHDAKEIKQKLLHHEELRDYDADCTCLMEHQKAGALIASKRNRYGFFFDTGTGKTLLGLEIMSKCFRNYGEHFLVICPKAIIYTAWLDDCDRFFPKMKILPILSNMSLQDYRNIFERWRKKGADLHHYTIRCFEDHASISLNEAKSLLVKEAQHYIVNPEKFRYDVKDLSASDFQMENRIPIQYRDIQGLIIDESAMLKNTGTDIAYLVYWYSANLKYTYLMSGKPAPNRVKEYKSQARLIANDYFSAVFGQYYLTRDVSDEALLMAIEKISLTISKFDCLQLPETSEIIREIELSPKEYDYYRQVRESTWQAIFSANDTEKQNPIFVQGNIMKLREVASGFLVKRNDEQGKDDLITKVHSKKTDELFQVIDELGEEQAIIWCQFRYEIETLEELLKKKGYTVSTAYGGTKDTYKNISDFINGRARFMIAHPKTLQYGATLVNCTYAIYYSLSYSLEEYYQSHDRIYRKGQTRPCTYIFLNTKGTIDEIMFRSIHEKLKSSEWAELVMRHLSEGLI